MIKHAKHINICDYASTQSLHTSRLTLGSALTKADRALVPSPLTPGGRGHVHLTSALTKVYFPCFLFILISLDGQENSTTTVCGPSKGGSKVSADRTKKKEERYLWYIDWSGFCVYFPLCISCPTSQWATLSLKLP